MKMRMPIAWFTGSSLVALLLTSCADTSRQDTVRELTGSAMGTVYSIKIVAPPAELSVESLQREVEQLLSAVEQQMSTYIADSEISRFNAQRAHDWFDVSRELCEVVAEALTLSAASAGAFDITVGPLVNLWGFGPAGAVIEPPDAGLIDVLLDSIGYTALHAECSLPALRKDVPGLYVDLSAFAKGYGVDRLAALLEARGVTNYLVEIGGEMRLRGSNAKGEQWAIAIEAPMPGGRSVYRIVKLTDAGIATSGDYRNYFEHEGRRYSHTIDPRTGYPVDHAAASVTVVANTAAYADAMATALLVLGPEDGFRFAEQEGLAVYYLLRNDGEFEERVSSRFASKVSYQ